MSKSKFVLKKNPGLTLLTTLYLFFFVNSVVILLTNYFFPSHIVLGTSHISKTWAVIHSMSTLAFINAFAIPFARELERIKGRPLAHKEWVIKYFALNFISLWVIARLAEQLGLGLSSWLVVFALAVVFDITQGIAIMWFKKQ